MLSKCFLNTNRLEAVITTSGSLFHCLITSVKNFSLTTNVNIPNATLWHSLASITRDISTSLSTPHHKTAIEWWLHCTLTPPSRKNKKPPKNPQLLLASHALSPFLLPSFVHILIFCVFLIVRNPKLYTLLEGRLHQCWAQWDSHFFQPVSYPAFNTFQNKVGHFGHQCMLLNHTDLTIYQNSLDPSVQGCTPATCPLTSKCTQDCTVPGAKSSICFCSISCSWWLPSTPI